MMTFVCGVIFRSTSSGSSVIVAGSMSAKTMVAPRFMAWSTDAQKVMLWQMISSPTPSPQPNIAVCSEAVPVLWPSAYFMPCHSAKSRSNSTVTSVPDMAPRRSTSSAAASSSSVMIGHLKMSPGVGPHCRLSAQDCELLHGCCLPPGPARPLPLVVSLPVLPVLRHGRHRPAQRRMFANTALIALTSPAPLTGVCEPSYMNGPRNPSATSAPKMAGKSSCPWPGSR